MKLPNSRCLSAEQSSCLLLLAPLTPLFSPIVPSFGHHLDSIHLLNETTEEGVDVRVGEGASGPFHKEEKVQTNKEINTRCKRQVCSYSPGHQGQLLSID